MQKQQDAVRAALAESAEAAKKLADADAMHAKALEDAKAESAKVTDEAKQDSERIASSAAGAGGRRRRTDQGPRRTTGSADAPAAHPAAARRVSATRSVQKAAELVRAHVADPGRAGGDRRPLPRRARRRWRRPSPVIETGATVRLRAASRQARAALADEFDDVAGRLRDPGLTTLADELAAVVVLLVTRARAHQAPRRADRRRRRPRSAGRPTAVGQGRRPHPGSAAHRRLAAVVGRGRPGRRHRAHRPAGAAEARRGRRRGRRGGGAAVPVRSRPRRRAAADRAAERLHHPGRGSNRAAGQGPRRIGVNGTAAALLSQTVGLLRGERADEAVIDLAELAVARGAARSSRT